MNRGLKDPKDTKPVTRHEASDAVSGDDAAPPVELDVLSLSFVTDERPGNGSPRCFWNVKPTGDYTADCEKGHELALEAVAFIRQDRSGLSTHLLGWIVGDMPRGKEMTDIEVGFLYGFAHMAAHGEASFRRVLAYWAEKAAQRAGAS